MKMDIISLLVIFFLLATVIKIATDNAADVLVALSSCEKLRWFRNAKKYKLVIALILTAFGVVGLNTGVLELLKVPLEVSRSWFHYFDMVVTILFLTKGSQAIHKLDDAWKNYKAGDQNV